MSENVRNSPVPTSSNEWFLFCGIFPVVLFLIELIIAQLFSFFGDSFWMVGMFSSLAILLLLFMYDAFFIKVGRQINLFEMIRAPLNKRNRITDRTGLSFLIAFAGIFGVGMYNGWAPNNLIKLLTLILLLLLLVLHFILEIWYGVEIKPVKLNMKIALLESVPGLGIVLIFFVIPYISLWSQNNLIDFIIVSLLLLLLIPYFILKNKVFRPDYSGIH